MIEHGEQIGVTAAATQPAGSPPRPKSLEDLYEVLQMYNEVTEKLQGSHERLQQEVVRLREQLEEKNRELEMKKRLAALGEMAAGIAHEIRNPLGGIQLYASSLLADVSDRPVAAELVKKISNCVKGLNTLVSDMLTFTRDLQLAKRKEELSEIVAGAIELARPALAEKNVTVDVDRSVERPIEADGRLLSRVLLNLILNAADAIGEMEPRQPGAIAIRAQMAGKKTVLIVEDNGPGIPADMLEKIFDPFFTTKHTGTGLGLAIVHRIIEAHGGRITAENRPAPAHGACFQIVL